MKSETIDYINVGLLIISFITAIYLPFELFLFSYAFLGPLHYLTEINWLDDKKYFIKSKTNVYKLFVFFAGIVAIYPLIKYVDYDNELLNFMRPKKHVFLLISFMFSTSLIFLTKTKELIFAIVFSILFSVLCVYLIPKIVLVLGVFLPTLIHVYVFTLLFMVYGQLKQLTKAGVSSVVLLALVPFIIVFVDIVPNSYEASEFIQHTFLESGFLSINTILAEFFTDINNSNISLMSPVVLKVQVFIAFAYTYHYLNWFSKTSIIRWKSSLNSRRTKFIVLIWLGSISIFLYDYITGLIVLFFLSMLHVILEFPLNVVTIKEIVRASLKKLNLK